MSLLLWTIFGGAGSSVPVVVSGVEDSSLVWLNPSGIGSIGTQLNSDPLTGGLGSNSLTGSAVSARLNTDPTTGGLGQPDF